VTPDVAIAADGQTADALCAGSDACDPTCNARARASTRALELARRFVPADCIEAMLAGEFGLSDDEAADVVTELAPALFRESKRGAGDLAEYLAKLAVGHADTRSATSVSLAAATLLARHHLGLDGVGPDEKVRKLLQQAELDAAKHLAGRTKRGHLTVAGGRAA
jgi:hypothetical protein